MAAVGSSQELGLINEDQNKRNTVHNVEAVPSQFLSRPTPGGGAPMAQPGGRTDGARAVALLQLPSES